MYTFDVCATVLIDVAFLKSSNKEIKKMNNGKVGVAPFQVSPMDSNQGY